MVQTGVIYDPQNRMDSACLRVVGTVYQAADPSMNGRSRTHGARLNCSKQFAVAQSVVTQLSTRLAQCHNLSMGSCVVVGQIAIPSPPHHLPGAHHDRSHRYLSLSQRALRTAQGLFHPELVGRMLIG